MNTPWLSPSEDIALASPDLIASLIGQLAGPRSSARDRTIRAVPTWLGELMSAGPSPAAEAPRAKAVPAARVEPPASAPPIKAKSMASGCRGRKCGQCPQCLDNARWDRIFNEKFADPNYYGKLNIRHSSTLAEVRA